MIRIAAIVCVALLIVAPGFAAPPTREQAAANKVAAEQKLQKLRAELNALAATQSELESKRSDVSKALKAADSSLGTAGRTLRETEAAIAAQQARLDNLQQQQAALQANLAKQHAALATLLRSAYALGRTEQIKLLLAQDRVGDAGRALAYHRYFEAARLQRIKMLSAQLQQLAELTRQVREQRSTLDVAHEQQRAQLADLQTQRGKQGKVAAQIESQYRDQGSRIKALGRDAQSLENLMDRLTKVMAQAPKPVLMPPAHRGRPGKPSNLPPPVVPFIGAAGHLAWPLQGNLIASYGGAMADGRPSTGLLISGSAGADVHAVADGRVAFAEWMKGYGLIIIVDHGGGLMSLYANNEALLKNAGDAVHAGDALSTVGSSGGQGRNALYFEIRKNGKAVDPRGWLKSR